MFGQAPQGWVGLVRSSELSFLGARGTSGTACNLKFCHHLILCRRCIDAVTAVGGDFAIVVQSVATVVIQRAGPDVVDAIHQPHERCSAGRVEPAEPSSRAPCLLWLGHEAVQCLASSARPGVANAVAPVPYPSPPAARPPQNHPIKKAPTNAGCAKPEPFRVHIPSPWVLCVCVRARVMKAGSGGDRTATLATAPHKRRCWKKSHHGSSGVACNCGQAPHRRAAPTPVQCI